MTREGENATGGIGGRIEGRGVERAPQARRAGDGRIEGAHEPIPYSTQDFRNEIVRVKRLRRVVAILCGLAIALVAAAVVMAVLLGVPGSIRVVDTSSLSPSVEQGNVVIAPKTDTFGEGDVVVYRDASGAERFGRVLACAGAWVNLSSDGSVVISDVSLEGATSADVVAEGESIIVSRQVPDSSCIVLADGVGDPTETLTSLENPIAYDSVVGRVSYRIWPLF